MVAERRDKALRARPLDLWGIAFTGVLASGFVGGTTNVVNGLVSPQYFETVLGWGRRGIKDVWRASIAQGIYEGLLYGVAFSLIFTAATGIITRSTCPYRFAMRHLLGILAGTYAAWALGGLAAIGLALLSPEFYQQHFFGVPREPVPMVRYAWVGGSIWGVELGGLVSVILGLIVLRSNWFRTQEQDQLAYVSDL